MTTATTAKKKVQRVKKTRTTKKVSREAPPEFGPVRKFEIKNLHRHPDNRHPSDEDIAETSASMRSHGQLEAILIRQEPGGRFEILSGETRFLAAKKLKWKEIDARCGTKVSDAAAIKLIAAGNAARHDLDPVQRARLLLRLCDPIDKGGGGLSQEEAGEEVGLSRSAVSNCIRLLKLSSVVLDAISGGRLPESYARAMTGLFDGPGAGVAERAILKTLPKTGCVSDEVTRRHWSKQVKALIGEIAQEVRTAKKHEIGGGCGLQSPGNKWSPTYFKLTTDVVLELQLFEFDGTTYCVNKKRWKQLNAKEATKIKTDLAKRNGPAAGKVPKLTPAQRKQKDERAVAIYSAKILHWRASWVSELICDSIGNHLDSVERFVNWILVGGLSMNNRGVDEVMARMMPWVSVSDDQWVDSEDKWFWFDNCDDEMLAIAKLKICLHLLRLEGKPEYPVIPYKVVDGLARQCNINLADDWCCLPFDSGGRRHMFYSLHSTEQLDAIAEVYGLDLSKAKTRQAKIDLLLPVDDVMPKIIARI